MHRLLAILALGMSAFAQTTVINGWGSSSGGDSAPVATVPALSGFAWVNQGTNTAVQTTASGPILMTFPSVITGSVNWRGLFVSQPSPPYKLQAQIKMSVLLFANTQLAGVYFYDGTKLEGFEFLSQSGGTTPRVEQITNVTSDSSSAYTGQSFIGNPLSPMNAAIWVQLRNDGTTIYFDYSFDGVNFVNVYSEAIGSFLTPTKIGFGGLSAVSGGANLLQVDLLAWTIVGNATL